MQFFQQKDLDNLKKDLTDNHTGLYNKSVLYILMDTILKQHKRYEENWSFIIMDCDSDRTRSSCNNISQKEIDKAIADRLISICRKSDVLFHCDDGLFCILTRVFEGDDTIKFCEKLSRNMKDLRFNECVIDVNPKFGITFSELKDTPETFSERSYDALRKALSSDEDMVVQA